MADKKRKKWYICRLLQGRVPGSGVNRDLELGKEIFFADDVRIIEIHFAMEPAWDKFPLLGISSNPAPRFVKLGVGSHMGEREHVPARQGPHFPIRV